MEIYVRKSDGTDAKFHNAQSVTRNDETLVIQFDKNKREELARSDVKEVVLTDIAA